MSVLSNIASPISFSQPDETVSMNSILPVHDLCAALSEIESILASLCEAKGLALGSRLAVVDALYTAAEPFCATLYADYLAQLRGHAADEARLWNALNRFWQHVERVHACLAAELLQAGRGADSTLLMQRALVALSAQTKLARLRYWAVDARLWRELGRLFVLAESAHAVIPDVLMHAWAGIFMREMAAPQNLLPREIEIVDRLAARYAAHFIFSRTAWPKAAVCFDLSAGRVPSRRFISEQLTVDSRFFGAGASYRDAALDMLAIEQAGNLDAFPDLADFKLDEVLRMLRHVAQLWSPNPPARAHDRSEVLSRVMIVFDRDEIRRKVANRDRGFMPIKPINRQSATARLTESWVVYDESTGGLGAEIPIQSRDWLYAGKFIGFKREGADEWGVGVIRRIELDQCSNGRVGIQILSEKPRIVRLRPLSATQFAMWDSAHPRMGDDYGYGLLLSPPQEQALGMLLIPHDAYGEAPYFEWARGESSVLIAVTKQAVHTDEYDLLMVRSA